MSTPQIPNHIQSKRPRFPRWLTPFYFAIVMPLALGVVPWAISLLTPYYGWSANVPSLVNLLGLIPVAVGVSCIIWIIVLHYEQAPDGWELEPTPTYLLVRGPYKFTRNPSYLSVVIIMLGWAILYGSLSLLIAAVIAGVFFHFGVVQYEERRLETRFGDSYRSYKQQVPRWLGKI